MSKHPLGLSGGPCGYYPNVTVIFGLFMIVLTVAGAEFVRGTCRRQLTASVSVRAMPQRVSVD